MITYLIDRSLLLRYSEQLFELGDLEKAYEEKIEAKFREDGCYFQLTELEGKDEDDDLSYGMVTLAKALNIVHYIMYLLYFHTERFSVLLRFTSCLQVQLMVISQSMSWMREKMIVIIRKDV